MLKLVRNLLLGYLIANSGVLAQTAYFPSGVFSPQTRWDNEAAKLHSESLLIAHEPSLLNVQTSSTTFRLLWFPSFDDTWIVRLHILPDRSGRLTIKIIGGRGSKHPGELIRAEVKTLTNSEISPLVTAPAMQQFWKLKSRGRQSGCDGADWLLEGVRSSTYHVVDRWSPAQGPVKDIGQYLALTLAGLHSHLPDQPMY